MFMVFQHRQVGCKFTNPAWSAANIKEYSVEGPHGGDNDVNYWAKGLEFLACDNQEMIIAASDKYGVEVDVTRPLDEDGNEEERGGKIAALYGESLFHKSGQVKVDGFTKDDTYEDLDDEPSYEVDERMNMRAKKATQNGMSKKATKGLEELLKKYRSTFWIRLVSVGPARFRPMKMALNGTERPVKGKVRMYPADPRRFLSTYTDELVKMGFLESFRQAAWQAAPQLVPKESKS